MISDFHAWMANPSPSEHLSLAPRLASFPFESFRLDLLSSQDLSVPVHTVFYIDVLLAGVSLKDLSCLWVLCGQLSFEQFLESARCLKRQLSFAYLPTQNPQQALSSLPRANCFAIQGSLLPPLLQSWVSVMIAVVFPLA